MKEYGILIANKFFFSFRHYDYGDSVICMPRLSIIPKLNDIAGNGEQEISNVEIEIDNTDGYLSQFIGEMCLAECQIIELPSNILFTGTISEVSLTLSLKVLVEG